jgi:vacuolar-type H+-ATPase subunit H
MSSAELDALEREVEATRAKFAADVGRLRDPRSYRLLKDDLLAEAKQTKDELLDKAKNVASDVAQDLLKQVKEKAIANPAATAAIGAGLAWRLFTRPPIASILVGLGLVSLWRTMPPEPPRSLKDAVWGWAEGADDLQERASDLQRGVAQQVQDIAHQARATFHDAQDVVEHAAEGARAQAEKAASVVQDTFSDPQTRDNVLLGAAALAVAAAVGISYQRRNESRAA